MLSTDVTETNRGPDVASGPSSFTRPAALLQRVCPRVQLGSVLFEAFYYLRIAEIARMDPDALRLCSKRCRRLSRIRRLLRHLQVNAHRHGRLMGSRNVQTVTVHHGLSRNGVLPRRGVAGQGRGLATRCDRRSRLPDAQDTALRSPVLTPKALVEQLHIAPQTATALLGGPRTVGLVREVTGWPSLRVFSA